MDLTDNHGRNINYMRISITDRCNLRCCYCMPEDILPVPAEKLLTYDEIVSVCEEAAVLGITRFKITGGEPLMRKDCPKLVERIKKITGVEQVTMTTNGVFLKEELDALLQAGLDGVNISIDTLSAQTYEQLTGRNELPSVLESLDAALKAGISVKVNTVLQKEINEKEWQELAELARNRPVDVRFIELMPLGCGKKGNGISNKKLLQNMWEQYPEIKPDFHVHGNGPAVYYQIPGFLGGIGLISAIHGKFCSACNRIRMTSTGGIKSCLCYEETGSVLEAARAGNRREVRNLLKKAIAEKPEMHCFDTVHRITEYRKMAQIGG